MRIKFLAFLALLLFTVACSKDDEMTVILKTSGTLSVNLTNTNGIGISNSMVKLYENTATSNSEYIDAIVTDINGHANFGNVNEGTYILIVDSAKVDGVKYKPIKKVQVISGSAKEVTINVQEYVGTINFTFRKYFNTTNTYESFADLNILLLPYETFAFGASLSELKQNAEFSGITNEQGFCSLKIPSGRTFYLTIYDSNDKKEIINLVWVDKDDITNYSSTIWENDLE